MSASTTTPSAQSTPSKQLVERHFSRRLQMDMVGDGALVGAKVQPLDSVGIYVLLEGLIFGFHVYWVSYVFIWPLLIVAAMFFRRFALFQGERAALPWAVVAAFWGLLFGPLMYIPWFCIMGGWKGYFAMWISGIPFDLVHCAGNFAGTLALYWPLYKVMAALVGRKKTT